MALLHFPKGPRTFWGCIVMGCIILGCIIGDALFLDAFVATDFRRCTVWDTFHFRGCSILGCILGGCIWDAFFGILSTHLESITNIITLHPSPKPTPKVKTSAPRIKHSTHQSGKRTPNTKTLHQPVPNLLFVYQRGIAEICCAESTCITAI